MKTMCHIPNVYKTRNLEHRSTTFEFTALSMTAEENGRRVNVVHFLRLTKEDVSALLFNKLHIVTVGSKRTSVLIRALEASRKQSKQSAGVDVLVL